MINPSLRTMNIEEINVPAPWGRLAVKLWGDKTNTAVITVHGIFDNIGAFDRLIPLLPNIFYYICVDLPGHGKSSHWPANNTLKSLDNLLAYHIIANYFKRKEYILLGHSYGGQLAYFYTQLFPEKVKKLILLDTLSLHTYSMYSLKEKLRGTFESYFNTTNRLQNGAPPEYTYEEALQKLIESRVASEMTREAAIPLLNRMIVPGENGKIKLSFDQRYKYVLNPLFDVRSMTDFIKKEPVLCPMLIIMANESVMQMVLFKDVLKLYKASGNIIINIVQGDHDVHNVHPERVAPLITTFLLGNSKL